MVNVEDKAKQAFEDISNIDKLNCGGCLFAAYGVWLHLKNCGYDMENVVIVQLSNNPHDYSNNTMYIESGEGVPDSASHFALSIDGGETLMDSTGWDSEAIASKFKLGSEYRELVIPSHKVEEFSENCLKKADWNYSFVREVSVPIINRRLNVDLDHRYESENEDEYTLELLF